MSRAWPCLALLACVALLACLAPAAARAQDDGPRVYQLQPVGAQVLTAFAVVKRGNEGPDPGQLFGAQRTANNILVFRWAGTFDLLGRQLNPFVIVPTGSVTVTPADGRAMTSAGLGDAQIGAVLGLVGEPALSRAEHADFRTAFSMGLLGRIYFPTGAYDSAKAVNLGAHRLTYQVGLPTTLLLGQSYADPRLTTLELLPTVTFYGANDAPFQGARATKDPLFSLEAHLTHSFSRRIWVSADVLYRAGGETATDGVAAANAQRGWSAGASGAVPLGARVNLILTYEHVVERSDNGPIGWFFRTALVAPF
jgi:hypothetical protein